MDDYFGDSESWDSEGGGLLSVRLTSLLGAAHFDPYLGEFKAVSCAAIDWFKAASDHTGQTDNE